jgi:hypothetical protein
VAAGTDAVGAGTRRPRLIVPRLTSPNGIEKNIGGQRTKRLTPQIVRSKLRAVFCQMTTPGDVDELPPSGAAAARNASSSCVRELISSLR